MNILKSINHPFITTMYGTSQDQKHLYIVLEFVEGCDLYSRIRSMGNLTENVARFYASEILVALEYLHSFKIAFRDLKPENILINR